MDRFTSIRCNSAPTPTPLNHSPEHQPQSTFTFRPRQHPCPNQRSPPARVPASPALPPRINNTPRAADKLPRRRRVTPIQKFKSCRHLERHFIARSMASTSHSPQHRAHDPIPPQRRRKHSRYKHHHKRSPAALRHNYSLSIPFAPGYCCPFSAR